jgi:galactokinase
MSAPCFVARAPGRVNLIGEHTDYNAGLALPMTIDRAVRARWRPDPGSPGLRLGSPPDHEPAVVDAGAPAEAIGEIEPSWARFPVAVASLLGAATGGTLEISSTVPEGAGLSSSAALCVASALALGTGSGRPEAPGTQVSDPLEAARLCQRAESLAGSPVGLMDPLVSIVGRRNHAVFIDFSTPTWSHVMLPPGLEVLVVDSGERRSLRESPYGARRRECDEAAAALGPLGRLELEDVARLASATLRRRARHVVTECRRVRDVVAALRDGDLAAVGAAMDESHESMAHDFEASTPGIDALVASVRRLPAVYGARITGGGFGGCVVAACRQGAGLAERWPGRAWIVKATEGASVDVG